jgi:hypothetical protein
MKTIEEVMSAHEPFVSQQERLYTQQQVEKMLADYGRDIVDECAGSFECTIESVYVPGAVNERPEEPVLVRASIIQVKSKIK